MVLFLRDFCKETGIRKRKIEVKELDVNTNQSKQPAKLLQEIQLLFQLKNQNRLTF